MIQSSDPSSIVEELMDTLSALPHPKECPKCGSRLAYVKIMFFSAREDGETWPILLPLCAKCDPTIDSAKFSLPVAC
jgi:hypothetical protein